MAKENKDYIAQMQGGKSFVKAKADSFGIGKVHLSFVQHSGKPECHQEAAIEGYLRFEDAAQLYYLCMSGDIKKKYSQSIKKAQVAQSKYPEPVWSYNGGSNAKYDQMNNLVKPCRYYAMQVSPGSKSEIVFQIMEGEGEVTETGGFMLKKGATLKRINVPFTFLDFCSFVVTVHDAVSAYQSYRITVGMNAMEDNEYTPYKMRSDAQQNTPAQQSAPQPITNPAPVTAPAPVSQPVATTPAPSVVYIMYDSLGKTFQAADSAQKILKMLDKLTKALQLNTAEHFAPINQASTFEAVRSAVYSGAADVPAIFYRGANNAECSVAIRRVEVAHGE